MAAGDLCGLADVKSWLSIGTSATGDDSLLTRLITATSADFLAEIDRYDFFAASFTDVLRGRALAQIPIRMDEPYLGSHRIVLRHWPVNSITSLVLDGVTVPASTDGVASGYWLDTNTDPENRQTVTLIGYVFTQMSIATVAYDAGYEAVPGDVAQAAIEWVAARYRNRASGGMSSQRLSEGRSQSEDVSFVPWDIPKSTQRVIERYKTGAVALMFSTHD